VWWLDGETGINEALAVDRLAAPQTTAYKLTKLGEVRIQLRLSAFDHDHFFVGAIIFVTRPTLVSPAYRLSCLSITQ
jgi:hypothetical protein